MKIAAVQLSPAFDPAENLEKMRHFAAEAASAGAKVIVFPEQTMVLLSTVTPARLTEIADEWWETFAAVTAELAAQHDAVVVMAGFEPSGSTESATSRSSNTLLSSNTMLPFNTMLAIGPDGTEIARYRKLHLYEAFSASEAEHTLAGTELPPVFHVEHRGETLTIGLANCYDVRFPELFRSLVDRGANAFILSAAWVSGPGKEAQWTLLTAARALENVSWVVASAAVGGGANNAATTGLSRIVDPLGAVVAALGEREEGVVVAEVEAASVDRARRILPAIANRRIRLGYEVEQSA